MSEENTLACREESETDKLLRHLFNANGIFPTLSVPAAKPASPMEQAWQGLLVKLQNLTSEHSAHDCIENLVCHACKDLVTRLRWINKMRHALREGEIASEDTKLFTESVIGEINAVMPLLAQDRMNDKRRVPGLSKTRRRLLRRLLKIHREKRNHILNQGGDSECVQSPQEAQKTTVDKQAEQLCEKRRIALRKHRAREKRQHLQKQLVQFVDRVKGEMPNENSSASTGNSNIAPNTDNYSMRNPDPLPD